MNIYLEVYGCTANKSDASIIKGIAKDRGHRIVDDIKDADTIVLLTCTVIGSTEQRMLSRIKKLNKLGKPLIVSGCMAAVQPDLIREISPDSSLVPPDKISTVVDLIEGRKTLHKFTTKTSLPRCYDGVIAPIAISEGCNFSCSYCITTKARGKLVSYPMKEIVKAVEDAVGKGIVEIQLTAQDVASYGMDTGEKLSELINRVSDVKGSFRIRIGMMNPSLLLPQIDEIIEAYTNDKVYKFLHLPVQSGDNEVLKRMNRKYSAEDFVNIVNAFRTRFPDLTLSTDIIVGFPGESEQAFLKTIELLKEVKPDIVNITRFSPRPHTKAKMFSDKIPTKIAKERSRKLTLLCKEISRDRNKLYLNKCCNVVITERGKGSTVVGRTDTYKPVVIYSDISLGTFGKAKIEKITDNYLIGKLI